MLTEAGLVIQMRKPPGAEVKAKGRGHAHSVYRGVEVATTITAHSCQWEFWPRAAGALEVSREVRNLNV